MCAVSMIFDNYRQNTQPAQWTWPMVNDFTEIIKRLDELDKKLGIQECHDPAKAEWLKAIEERLAKLEQAKEAK